MIPEHFSLSYYQVLKIYEPEIITPPHPSNCVNLLWILKSRVSGQASRKWNSPCQGSQSTIGQAAFVKITENQRKTARKKTVSSSFFPPSRHHHFFHNALINFDSIFEEQVTPKLSGLKAQWLIFMGLWVVWAVMKAELSWEDGLQEDWASHCRSVGQQDGSTPRLSSLSGQELAETCFSRGGRRCKREPEEAMRPLITCAWNWALSLSSTWSQQVISLSPKPKKQEIPLTMRQEYGCRGRWRIKVIQSTNLNHPQL